MSFTLKKIVLPVTMAFCAISASAATYTQTVPGHNGPMTVKVAIDSGKIEMRVLFPDLLTRAK